MQNTSPLKFRAPAYYFMYFAGAAALSPFLALYYQSRGLTGSQIGLLSAISPLVGLVAAPLWSGFADATRRHKAISICATLGAVAAALLIGSAASLVWLIPVVIGFAFLSAPVMPLMDSSTMVMLGGRRDQYGKIRLWGTVGWAVAAPVVGWLIQRGGLEWSFYAYAALIGVALLISIPIPMGNAHVTAPFRSGVRALVTSPRWVFFLVIIFFIGISATSVSTYLLLYMKSLGADATLIGFSLTISTVSEVPMYFFADRILRRFKWRGLLVIALVIYIVRLLLYTVVVSPTIMVVIQLVHGFTVPAIWAAGISFVAESAPPGLEATSQAIFAGVLNGLAAATGAYLGGVIYQNYGAVIMFRVFAAILFAALLLLVFLGNRIPSTIEKPLDILP
ncbi:MAG: major facilitator superfamily domain-containing protein 6 [Anaerolineales bacterium]